MITIKISEDDVNVADEMARAVMRKAGLVIAFHHTRWAHEEYIAFPSATDAERAGYSQVDHVNDRWTQKYRHQMPRGTVSVADHVRVLRA